MKQIFEVWGIPEVLEHRPARADRLITREEVETIMEHNPRTIFPVSGDCLEGAQVLDADGCASTSPTAPLRPGIRAGAGTAALTSACAGPCLAGEHGPR